MKPDTNQLSLFAKQTPTPTGNHDRIEFCIRCGAQIVVQRYTVGGFVSEYRSRTGECLACGSQPKLPHK